jgi:hypothetical protein
MKKLIIIITSCVGISLVSCLDSEERITLNQNKSGTYEFTVGIGNSPMLQSAMQQSGQTLEKKDTVIYFKGFTDTATSLTLEEKSILENGKIHLAMNDDIKVEFFLPFKDIAQLLYIKQHTFELISKIKPDKSMMDDDGDDSLSMFPGMNSGDLSSMNSAGKLMNPTQDAFAFNIDKNTISNKAKDTAGLKQAFASDSMQMIKQMIPFVGDFNYKTTFVLPSPVKKYSGGSETKLSDDKKTISFINTLSGLLDDPKSLEYLVEY